MQIKLVDENMLEEERVEENYMLVFLDLRDSHEETPPMLWRCLLSMAIQIFTKPTKRRPADINIWCA